MCENSHSDPFQLMSLRGLSPEAISFCWEIIILLSNPTTIHFNEIDHRERSEGVHLLVLEYIGELVI